MEEIRLNAHAKLNLSLRIVGRRPNGYHDIVSLMQGIGLSDIITVKKCAENGTKYNLPHCTINEHVVYLCTDEKTIPLNMDNLAFKGIAALAKNDDTRFPGADIIVEIEKRLPVAAGIAGGSGNAAAAMLGLNALMGSPLSLRELMDIGESVGADVPFSIFMNAAMNKAVLGELAGIEEACPAAWVSGIGEIVEAAEPVNMHVIMANPGISVSTKEAYEAIDSIGYEDADIADAKALFVNDLEKYTLEYYPKAAELKSYMREHLDADEIMMSGSGPTIAAYYKDEEKAKVDAGKFPEGAADNPAWKIWLTSTGLCN